MPDLPPLAGVRIVEFLGVGPAPFGCLLLADLGADVVAIARPGQPTATPGGKRSMDRNRPVLDVDLRRPGALAAVEQLVRRADVLVEGFRPGVMERLGLGPEPARAANPALVYARMTGWGQTGPMAARAGHDITYIAPTGALHSARRSGHAPVPPANLLGDFGGGGMYLVVAILAALVQRQRTGVGQVLDVAIVDGTTYLTTMLQEYRSAGLWSDDAGTNRLDTGAPFYDVYRCADGGHVAVGALEEPFFAALVDLLGLDPDLCRTRHDRATWPRLRELIAAVIALRTRDEWAALALPTDACLTPVLSLAEAPTHPQLAARGVLRASADGAGVTPRLPLGHRDDRPDAELTLRRWGLGDAEVARLHTAGSAG